MACQNHSEVLKHVLYNRGEVISDQFDHLKVIGFRVSSFYFGEKTAKTGLFGKFSLKGGSPIPKCICQNTDKK